MEKNEENTNEFWKTAPKLLESMMKNPTRKYNYDDLLGEQPPDENTFKALPRIPPFHLKSSSLDTTYKTYNPQIMEVIERSKRFDAITDERKSMRTPKILSMTSNLRSSNSPRQIFQVSGRKAQILLDFPEKSLKIHTSLGLNTRLKEFIGKVQDKYANLVKALEFKYETLSFDAVIEYLKKSSILLKRPTFTRDRQRIYAKSPLNYRYNRRSSNKYQEDFSSYVSEKMFLLSEIFDPFKTGSISKQHFYGILTMYEYTNFGMPKNLPSSRLDFNNLRHLQSLNAQVNEIKRIYKHYSDGKLLTRDGFGTLLRSICTDEHTEEILTYLVIGNKVNFGQFLSVIPLLLENYDNLMIKVQI